MIRARRVYLAGAGRVGGALLRQWHEGAEPRPPLTLAGVGTRAGTWWGRAGRSVPDGPGGWGPPDAEPAALVEAARVDPAAVFVDCTASPEIANTYEPLLRAGVPVVTANKLAFAAAPGDPVGLAPDWIRSGRCFHETTVAAGLPVLRTLADLVETGDEVERIEGVFSGTLGAVLDRVHAGATLSEAVATAVAAGLCEPDPQVDLSGVDVGRKALILARAAGLADGWNEVEDDVEPLVPPGGGSLSALLQREGPRLARAARAATRRNRRLTYLAVVEPGRRRVSLQALPADHPCAQARGADNVVRIFTRRYRSPLTVAGPGAGPDVTAAGVRADLLRALRESPGQAPP